MKRLSTYFVTSIAAGVLIVAPIYLSLLILFRAMQAVTGLVKPFAKLLPEWLPADQLLSLLLVLLICLVIGVAVRTPAGRATRERIEKSFFERIPGYALFRSLTQQLAGSSQENVWKPCLAEIEEALVPAFIIEELDDGRFTVFVPSVPTRLAGPSTSSRENACTSLKSLSLRSSPGSRAGGQGRKTSWRRFR